MALRALRYGAFADSLQKRGRLFCSLAGACLLTAVSGCSSAPPATYDLSAPMDFGTIRGGRGQLAVFEPAATLPADSNRIVIRTGPEAVAYLTGAQWADKLPRLIQTRLIDAFENAHVLRAVGRPGLVADVSLQSEVRRFEADVTRGEAVVEIAVRLVGRTGRVIANRSFSATAPFATDNGPTITAALDQALAKTIRQIIPWAVQRI